MAKKYLFLIVAILILTTGCWDYRELNEMAIVGAVGIDYDDDKKLYDISVQILNAKKSASSSSSSSSQQQSPITVYQSKAKTIHEAFRNVVLESPKKLYIGHMDILVFGEDFVKKHLKEGIDFFFRDTESRKQFHIVIAKESKASEVVKILTPLEGIPAHNILENITAVSNYKGTVSDITFDEFMSQIYGEGIEAVMPSIIIEGKPEKGTTDKILTTSDPKTKLKIGTLGVFKDYKMIGYLDQEESIGYSILQNFLMSNIISFKCDDKDNYAAVEIESSKADVSLSIKKNKPKAIIKLSASGALSEYNCKTNLGDAKEIEKVRKMASKKFKSIVAKTIKAAQDKYKVDFIGFGEKIYENNYSYWKKNSKKWNKIFLDVPYDIIIDFKLPKKGASLNAAQEG